MLSQRIEDSFWRTVELTPNAHALLFEGGRWSYAELGRRAREFVRPLTSIAQHGIIGIHALKSPDTIALMLACLSAGVGYALLDTSAPAMRRAAMLRDCAARFLLFDDKHGHRPEVGESDAMLLPFSDLQASSTCNNFATGGSRWSRIAYVLYTSGSTGRPKGVPTTHENALAFMKWVRQELPVKAPDTIACCAPLHFDMHIFDVYCSLAQGASVYLPPEHANLFPEMLFNAVRSADVTVMYAVPSLWIRLLRESGLGREGWPSLRLALYAGEEFPSALLRRLSSRLRAPIFNIYGPVETNAITAIRLDDDHLALERVPIGYPVRHNAVFLLDPHDQVISKADVEGEIVVHGPNVFSGYLNESNDGQRPFVSVRADGREYWCYRTGDFAQRAQDGGYFFRGRRDQMVKISGVRIELGDVEAALAAHPAVTEAVALAVPASSETRQLRAFVVPTPAAAVSVTELFEWARARLPPAMVPREIILRSDFPRTSTGKLDRRKLSSEGAPV